MILYVYDQGQAAGNGAVCHWQGNANEQDLYILSGCSWKPYQPLLDGAVQRSALTFPPSALESLPRWPSDSLNLFFFFLTNYVSEDKPELDQSSSTLSPAILNQIRPFCVMSDIGLKVSYRLMWPRLSHLSARIQESWQSSQSMNPQITWCCLVLLSSSIFLVLVPTFWLILPAAELISADLLFHMIDSRTCSHNKACAPIKTM